MPTTAPKHPDPVEEPLVQGGHAYGTITEKVAGIPLVPRIPYQWYIAFGFAFVCLLAFLISLTYLLMVGVGIWGVNQPVGWGLDIINFVWWIGIGHAGTLISAILLLMRQRWRTSINRLAETMTLFAVMCAGLFPLAHLGRPWAFYWILPYPNALGMWPNFRSPLVWDVFAVSTYLTVSALFWYVGLIPDLATLRDKRKRGLSKYVFALTSWGWNGTSSHWHRYEAAYLVLAGISTPLVLSVHSIVSLDFAVSIIPGWHTTIFPPYFVAGAVFAGFAMVLTLVLPLRSWYNLKDLITDKHIDWCAKIMLTTGLIVFYGYLVEAFFAWYSGNFYEYMMMKNRWVGPYAPYYWALILCNGVITQALWFPKVRHKVVPLFLVSLAVSVGMWLERFVIVPISLHRDFLPSSWGMYNPTVWDIGIFVGTFAIFIGGMVLFVRFLPMIPMSEIRHLLHHEKHASSEGKHEG
ncbi:MAG: polysulfide reductase NrfD [Armatimonadetes bacterium]|uniref:Hydrogenase n=1 Tax=Candidatus Nitrosymbiomonas proteolyticus TaxID=2608984 RepID=A0A809S4W9_9BACT|nr:hydrogenase [Armatimonadota bacterium]MCK6632908.1 polysulfide reductase NrfD [Fimbriimonadaceae bacterium]BBO23816.1 hydrogenase [Candidatus Nitrosymbiomonas proteolyticus]NOG39095.1 polysulfide reductase NrfD [Armatimonadota bacterium]NUM39215.1 polysulfide reductase NrfD [Armatimonadota bacterium]